eukprot:343959_1
MQNLDSITIMEPLSPRMEVNDEYSKSLFHKYFGAGSISGAFLNFVAAVLGPGMLSFPFAIRETGLLLGSILLVICTFLIYISYNVLIISSSFLPMHNKNVLPSYLTLATQCNGYKLAIFAQITSMLTVVGVAVSHTVACGGIIVLTYKQFYKNSSEIYSLNENNLYKLCIVGISIMIVFPLSLFRNMSTLRFTSLFAVICSLVITIMLLIEYFIQCDDYFDIHTCFWKKHHFIKVIMDDNYTNLVKFSFRGIVTSFPIFVYGYVIHTNVFSIYIGLENKTSNKITKMSKVFKISLLMVFLYYFIVGSSGFLLFLHKTCGNILLNDFNYSKKLMISSIVFTIAIILSIPLHINVLRENINDIIWKQKQVSLYKHIFVTVLILLFCTLIAIFVRDIALIFGFIGSTTMPTVAFILPTYFFCKLMPKEYNQKYRKIKCISILICVIMICISVASIYYKIYALTTNSIATC